MATVFTTWLNNPGKAGKGGVLEDSGPISSLNLPGSQKLGHDFSAEFP